MEDPVPEESSRLRLVFLGLTVALVVGGLLLFVSKPEQVTEGTAGDEAALRAVRIERVVRQPVQARAEIAGVLEARRVVQLFSETRGPVLEVGAESLDRVEPGQVLVQVDPLQAVVAVERAEAMVARSRSQLALARSNLERLKGLSKRGVASDADLEDGQSGANVAAASVREARAELTRARDELANKTIAAPFAGVLRGFEVETGEYVSEGERLGELLDLGAARATVGLTDLEVVAVRAGEAVEARVPAWPGEQFPGRILRVGAASDLETKKFPVEVELPNDEGRLLPGMVASIALVLGTPEPRTVIPREAAIEEFGLRYVWVAEREEDGLVVHRRRVGVRVLPFQPARLEVLSGLEAGESIVVSGARDLREGERVRSSGSSSARPHGSTPLPGKGSAPE
jgi:membrane fusion protein (multidrug efflux system)